jgi:hypothetical protein
MNNLWVFGDSFSCPFTNKECRHWGTPYIKYKGYVPKVFSDCIAEELQLNQINKAKGGTDNYTIFETLCDNVDFILKNDLIIVGWSDINRFRWLVENGSWKTILPKFKDNHYNKLESEFLINQCIIRTELPFALYEVLKWMNLLKKMFGKQIIFWTPFLLNNSDIFCPRDFIKTSNLKMDTNGIVDDGHWDENTHKDLAKLILEVYYKSNNIIKLI